MTKNNFKLGAIREGTMDDAVKGEERKDGVGLTDRRTLLRTAGVAGAAGAAFARCDTRQVFARADHRSPGADGNHHVQGHRQTLVAVKMGLG